MGKITFDGLVTIATGLTRKDTRWQNQELLWSDFAARCSKTTRTAETYTDYLKAKKSVQDEIKDVGGFVGGYLNGGRRKAGNVINRQLLTLDVDHAADTSLWDTLDLLYGCAALMYSTHKHSPDRPRLRLVIPLSREVFCDEYQAIARKIADDLDIELFDTTTFEPSRLMYWPSTACDGEYLFKVADGAWLDADAILASYADWQDSSSWPASARDGERIAHAIKKQGDPLAKPGLIGAFNRQYSIASAIETFLADTYEPSYIAGRYSYKQGSTTGGLVIYDDVFAYSHHGTDPASSKLSSAYDLVRIHRFGLGDEDVKPGTPVNRLPSTKAMSDFVSGLPEIRQALVLDRYKEAHDDFAETETDTDWMAEIETDTKGRTLSTIENFRIILDNDPALKGKIVMDEFRARRVITADLPWRPLAKGEGWTDEDRECLQNYIEKAYQVHNATKLDSAVSVVITAHSYHPVVDYLKGLIWDGTKRAETVLIDYLGAEDSPYVRAVTRKFLAGAVARVMRPGCKFDYIPVLVGPQGIGKSSLARLLGRDWFSDTLVDIRGKEAYQQIAGVWIMEMAELVGLRRADLEAIKHFASKQSDDYRPPYGRNTIHQPRQTVFFGTTNDRDFLRDPSGNRRFWPIDVTGGPWAELNAEEIDQIWAEAYQLYQAGEKLYLNEELKQLARVAQGAHTKTDEREGLIQAFLEMGLPENWSEKDLYARRQWLASDESIREKGTHKRSRVCVPEIWCEVLGGDLRDIKREARNLHDIMRNIEGWELRERKTRCGIYGVVRAYERTK